MMIGADVVARGGVAVSEFGDDLALDERLQIFVDGRQTDAGQARLDGEINLLGRRVVFDAAQVLVDGHALRRELHTALVERPAQGFALVYFFLCGHRKLFTPFLSARIMD
ncbi:MAG: hypothetical protein QOD32_1197 [Pyrinomonadaceae bacterium]|nr:hypothetical protein [Pyrinomonadaceae bacterium]